MATRFQLQPNRPRIEPHQRSQLDSLSVGVGIFSVSGDAVAAVDLLLPIGFTSHKARGTTSAAVADDVLERRSFSIEYTPSDLRRLSADQGFMLPSELSQLGYRKLFWLEVPELRFATLMWRLVGGRPAPSSSSVLPKPRPMGFLGATWLRNISARELVDAATMPCIHPCNPPQQCRQTGCYCNRELHTCV
jgi:hypothetical protein